MTKSRPTCISAMGESSVSLLKASNLTICCFIIENLPIKDSPREANSPNFF